MMNLIRQARQRRGLTQAELAERVGTTAATVSRLEKDAMTVSTDWLTRFAAALDLHPSDLLESREHAAITLLGKVVRGGRVTSAAPTEFHLGMAGTDAVAVELATRQGPYEAGERLIGERLRGTSIISGVGHDCIVALKNGGHMVARLVGLPPLFTLVPLESGAPIFYDQDVEWVAPVAMRLHMMS